MDFTMITECQNECIDTMRDEMDRLYLKQHQIIEYQIDDDIEQFKCFQEGFSLPGSSKELDVFKFDNKHIIKAIKYFNEAFQEVDPYEGFMQSRYKNERGKLDIKDMLYGGMDPNNTKEHELFNAYSEALLKAFRVPNGNMDKGFKELQEQFDCKFKIFFSTNSKTSTGTIIKVDNEDPGKLDISKKKGFLLGKLGITINVNIKQILTMMPANIKLFGQTFTSIMLHEIYHNICHMIDARNTGIKDDIKKTICSIKKGDSKSSVVAKISNFIDRCINKLNVKKDSIKEKQRCINRMYVLSQIRTNPNAVKKFENDIKNNVDMTGNDEELDKYIDVLEQTKHVIKIFSIGKVVAASCTIIMACIGILSGSAIATIGGALYLAFMSLSMLMKRVVSLSSISVGVREEYYCDLFASMYQLPIHMKSFNRQIYLGKNNKDKVLRIRELEQSLSDTMKDEHPMDFDRELTSYRTAKQILASKKRIKPEIREYLEYIVNVHEGIDDVEGSRNNKQKKKLDPEAAADLKKLMNDFVKQTGVTVTESFIEKFCRGEYYGIGY